MADERYQWLDQEAAERLLRGESVDAVDDHARSQAERLAGALDAARTPAVLPAAHAELPGEAAALAAFRAAAAERAAAPVAAGPAGRTERAELGRVRLAAAPSAAPSRRWGRSFRYGLAAAVAAVTVGGVAVAAGTGVLPMVGPAPASSVTAGETTDPLVSEDPGIRQDPEAPPTRPGGDDPTPGASPTAGDDTGTSAPPTGGPDGHGTDTRGPGTPKPGTSTPGASTGTTGPGGKDKETGGTGGDPGGTNSWERVAKACREYRSGKLDATGRQGLMNTLRAGETLRRYCDRILGGATGTPEDGTKDGGKDSGNDDSKDSDGDAKDDGKPSDGRDGDSGDSRGDTDGSGGGKDRRDTALPWAPDSARLTAPLPLGIGVSARVPLPV